MGLFGIDIEKGLALAGRVDARYRPVFDKFSPADRAGVGFYFLPHNSRKEILGVTRPRVVKWYCPFADQREFPSGHRYCINVYAGCSHGCTYCYAAGYEAGEARCKESFKAKLLKDLSEIEEFDLPPAPVHLSNSTDPLQALEREQGLTLFTLGQLVRYRRYFTSVVILTKNPAVLLSGEYLSVLKELDGQGEGLRVEISLAFSLQADADFYDTGAPSVVSRMEAVRELRRNGIRVVLRIDPLLVRDPLPEGRCLADFGLPDSQSLSSLEKLVGFAAECGVMHIVYSVAKIVVPRDKPLSPAMEGLKGAYEFMARPERLDFRGGAWRLPSHIAQEQIVEPFLKICDSYGMKTLFCKQNLISTR